jgi:hypothetical protein
VSNALPTEIAMDTSTPQQVDATAQPQTEARAPASGGAEATQAQPAPEPASAEIRVEAPAEAPAEEEIRSAMARFGDVLKKPSVGATVTGGVILGAATMFGVVEAAVAAAAAYAAYRLLRKKQSA